MCWLIQRTAPHEPVSYWGVANRWVRRRVAAKVGEVLKSRIPDGALKLHDWDNAYQVAEWLRANQDLEYGEVIAVVPEPEPAA